MDIYERLKKDHDHHREIADRLARTSGDSPERAELWSTLQKEVASHASAEEQTFYAALLAMEDGQEQARHSVSEHEEASEVIEELAAMEKSSPNWLKKLKELKESLEHHMKEEEDEVFPLGRRLLDATTAERLAGEFDARKRSAAAD